MTFYTCPKCGRVLHQFVDTDSYPPKMRYVCYDCGWESEDLYISIMLEPYPEIVEEQERKSL